VPIYINTTIIVMARGSVVLKIRKVGVSRSDEVNEIFNLLNPSGRTRRWGSLSLEQK
jgi:hypothetical protein